MPKAAWPLPVETGNSCRPSLLSLVSHLPSQIPGDTGRALRLSGPRLGREAHLLEGELPLHPPHLPPGLFATRPQRAEVLAQTLQVYALEQGNLVTLSSAQGSGRERAAG